MKIVYNSHSLFVKDQKFRINRILAHSSIGDNTILRGMSRFFFKIRKKCKLSTISKVKGMVFEEAVVKVKKEIRLENQFKEPYLYQVVMHNDDYTPMDFVVSVLELFFHMDRDKAARLMHEVHTTGKAICGVFTKDVAITKAELVTGYARKHDHPLLCSVEVT